MDVVACQRNHRKIGDFERGLRFGEWTQFYENKQKMATEHTVTTNLTAHGLAGSRTVKNASMEHTSRVEKMDPGHLSLER